MFKTLILPLITNSLPMLVSTYLNAIQIFLFVLRESIQSNLDYPDYSIIGLFFAGPRRFFTNINYLSP